MLEDARSHKLLTGSIEEQKEYVEQWVLYKSKLQPNESGTWDILFPRRLFDANAFFVLKLDSLEYAQEFDLDIREERVRN